MPQPDKIKRRPDGSIDSGHYLAIGRRRRSHSLRRHCRSMLALLLGTAEPDVSARGPAFGRQVTGTNSPVSVSRASSLPAPMPK